MMVKTDADSDLTRPMGSSGVAKLARYQQSSRNFRKRKIPIYTPKASKLTTPLADHTTSPISSCGVSQKSKVSNSGPERYHPSHKRNKILGTCRFIALILPIRKTGKRE